MKTVKLVEIGREKKLETGKARGKLKIQKCRNCEKIGTPGKMEMPRQMTK